MTVSMIPGMTSTIKITDMEDKVLYSKNFTSEEAHNEFLETYGHSKVGIGRFESLVTISDSADQIDYFKKLFLPSVMQFGATYSAPLDLLTLPLRLIGVPIALFVNTILPEKPHPLTSLLEQPAPGEVKLLVTKEINSTPTVEKKVWKASKELIEGEQHLFLQAKPGQPETRMNYTSRIVQYQKDRKSNNWISTQWLPLKLQTGFRATVEVTDLNNQTLYTRKFTSEPRLQTFLNTYSVSKEGRSIIEMIMSPFIPTPSDTPHPLSELIKTDSVKEVLIKVREENVTQPKLAKDEKKIVLTKQTVTNSSLYVRLKTIFGTKIDNTCNQTTKICYKKVWEKEWTVYRTRKISGFKQDFSC